MHHDGAFFCRKSNIPLELMRLREHIESLYSDSEELTLLSEDCKALLEQLLTLNNTKGNGELDLSDFTVEILE